MSRILVTGAASFTARHLVPLLRAHAPSAELWGSDVVDVALEGMRSVPADLADAAAARALVRAAEPTHVLHLAGVSTPDPDRCYAVNLDGTRRLLEACAAMPRPAAVVVVSSAAVYGLTRPAESPVREDTPLRPVTPYGASKAAAEIAALSMHRRGLVPVTVVRPFNLVGPGLREGFAPSDFMAQARALRGAPGAALIRVGNLEPRRDFVDVRDAARAYLALLEHDDLRGRVFNVASERPVAVRALLEGVLAAVGVQAAIEVDPARVRPVEVVEQVGDPGALHAACGWSADIPLERSLRDMV
jgi:GDP-4-dehydro-6-deoxy-D-mannose reductase